ARRLVASLAAGRSAGKPLHHHFDRHWMRSLPQEVQACPKRPQASALRCAHSQQIGPVREARLDSAHMTIAVAVRTNSALVFATDSKLMARGMAGINPDGTPNWVDQSYDNATKVVHDRNKRLMALAAGAVNVGRTTATDMIAALNFPECASPQDEDDAIK